MKCVPLVGDSLPGLPGGGRYRYNQAWANTLPCTRAVREARPYGRRWAFPI